MPLRDINQSFEALGSEINLVFSQFDKQDRSIQAITARNAVLNKEMAIKLNNKLNSMGWRKSLKRFSPDEVKSIKLDPLSIRKKTIKYKASTRTIMKIMKGQY